MNYWCVDRARVLLKSTVVKHFKMKSLLLNGAANLFRWKLNLQLTSGGAIGGAAAPPDSHFITYGAPVHQVVNI